MIYIVHTPSGIPFYCFVAALTSQFTIFPNKTL